MQDVNSTATRAWDQGQRPFHGGRAHASVALRVAPARGPAGICQFTCVLRDRRYHVQLKSEQRRHKTRILCSRGALHLDIIRADAVQRHLARPGVFHPVACKGHRFLTYSCCQHNVTSTSRNMIRTFGPSDGNYQLRAAFRMQSQLVSDKLPIRCPQSCSVPSASQGSSLKTSPQRCSACTCTATSQVRPPMPRGPHRWAS